MTTETRRIQFDFVARDRGVKRQTQETSKAFEDMNTSVEGGAGKMGKLGSAGMKLGPVLAAVGAAAALVGPAIAKGLDAQDATAKFTAQLGLTATESQRIGGVAGKLYSNAYGESMDDVRGAITEVIRNMDGMRTASEADLKATTARAMDLATVMDEEVGRVTAAVSQIMRTGLAKNSREAFDIMARGAQLGANKAQDLADTLEEYSVHFKNMGLSGKQAMGLIVQGLQAGGRNADLVADTIKEFSIEAVAGGTRVSKGFKSLGLDARQMSAAFGKGGGSASHALDVVLDRLRAIKDPVKRNAVAIELFGTKAEDMGQALYALDPSSAVKGMGNLAGATDKAGKAMGDTAKSKLTAFKRSIEMNLTNAAGKAIVATQKLGGELSKGFKLGDSGKARGDVQKLGAAFRSAADWSKKHLVPALKDLGRWVKTELLPATRKFVDLYGKDALAAFKDVTKTIKDNRQNLQSLGRAMGTVVTVATRYLIPTFGFIAGSTLRGLAKGLSLLIRSVANTWGAFRKLQSIVGQVAAHVTRVFLAMVTKVVTAAAKAFGWVPGLGGKLRSAAKSVQNFSRDTNKWLDNINKRKDVQLRVFGKYHVNPDGSVVAKHAAGGPIRGPGGPTSDDVPILASAGEHMWTAREVNAVGGHGSMKRLRALARAGLLQGFATGGPVGVSVSAPTRGEMSSRVWRPLNSGLSRMSDTLSTALSRVLAKLYSAMAGGNGVVRAARSMIGYPYSWGGGGKGGPSRGIGRGANTYGFDCSGLTEYAWWKGARTSIGGTTYSQHPGSRRISSPRPGALGFPHMGHVMLASDRPGYVIQAPFTGSHVQEVRRSAPDWRWPKNARFYAGGEVKRLGEDYAGGFAGQRSGARVVGIAGDPGRRFQHRGAGGPVSAHVPYVVGEHGPEIITPARSGTVHPAGSTVVQVDVHVGHALASKREIADEVLSALRTAKRGGVNVKV